MKLLQRVEYEYRWDSRFPALEPRLLLHRRLSTGGEVHCLLMKRLPLRACLSGRLLRGSIHSSDIRTIHASVLQLRRFYRPSRARAEFLLSELLRNFSIQIAYAGPLLRHGTASLLDYTLQTSRRFLLYTLGSSVVAGRVHHCHGNLFSSNIFLIPREGIVFLDPVADTVRGRRMDLAGDGAAFYADLLLLSTQRRARTFADLVRCEVRDDLWFWLFNVYSLLKACVRIRFAVIEEASASCTGRRRVETERILLRAETVVNSMLRTISTTGPRLGLCFASSRVTE